MSYVGNRVWFIDDNQLKVRNYENGSINKVGENTEIIYWYHGYKGEFVSTSGTVAGDDLGTGESPGEIPSSFHEALVCGVLERLYAKNPETIQVAEYWAGKFKQKVIEAKKRTEVFNHGKGTFIKGAEF